MRQIGHVSVTADEPGVDLTRGGEGDSTFGLLHIAWQKSKRKSR